MPSGSIKFVMDVDEATVERIREEFRRFCYGFHTFSSKDAPAEGVWGPCTKCGTPWPSQARCPADPLPVVFDYGA